MDEQAQTGAASASVTTTLASTVPEVTVKGWRGGLLLVVPPDGIWADVLTQLDVKLDEARARSFWRGAQTTLDVGMRTVTSDEISLLTDRVKRTYGLVPVALVSQDEPTRIAGEKMGLAPFAELPTVKRTAREPDAEPASPTAEKMESAPVSKSAFYPNNALYVPNTMRSGQRVVHDGHLIVCGDVNPGAEVMAGGDVVVLGTLRGLAHAGCFGDEAARIVAGSLRSPQLRIASRIAASPDDGGKTAAAPRAPEVARIEGSEIVVFPL